MARLFPAALLAAVVGLGCIQSPPPGHQSPPTDEPAGTDDIHFHPLEPRSFRLSVRKEF